MQFMKNYLLHAGIKCSPYKAMFSIPSWIGLEHTYEQLLREMQHLIENEKDLEETVTDLHNKVCNSDKENASSEQLDPLGIENGQ